MECQNSAQKYFYNEMTSYKRLEAPYSFFLFIGVSSVSGHESKTYIVKKATNYNSLYINIFHFHSPPPTCSRDVTYISWCLLIVVKNFQNSSNEREKKKFLFALFVFSCFYTCLLLAVSLPLAVRNDTTTQQLNV